MNDIQREAEERLDASEERARIWSIVAIVIVAIIVALWSTTTPAEPLAIIATSSVPDGATTASAPAASEKYDRPGDADYVRLCGAGVCDWGAQQVWRRFGTLQANDRVDACVTDGLPPGTVIPRPWSAPADPCKAWLPVTKAELLAGQVPRIDLGWTQELKNADGSALTDLAGFRIVYGTAANALTQTVEIRDPNARGYLLLENLAWATTYYVAVKSFTSAGIESDKSNTIQHTTLAKPTAPPPPTKPVPPVVTVKQQQAYSVSDGDDRYVLSTTPVGTVPVGTTCIRQHQPVLEYFLVPRMSVKLNTGVTTRPRRIAAKCG